MSYFGDPSVPLSYQSNYFGRPISYSGSGNGATAGAPSNAGTKMSGSDPSFGAPSPYSPPARGPVTSTTPTVAKWPTGTPKISDTGLSNYITGSWNQTPRLPQANPTPEGSTQSPYGYASGPGILESWFNQRANGTDPGYQYAMNRGMDAIDNRMSAGGSYNSGARGQQLSDYAANMGAQRESQLDALAGGASGEYQNRLNSMFGQGQALANGQAGQLTAYDLGAAGNMSAANQAQAQMYLNSAGQQQQANQGFANNVMNLYGLYRSGNSSGGGGGYDYGKV